jgi:hypothetical protein
LAAIDLKAMFKWRNANFAPSALGIANIILPIMAAVTAQFGKAISETTLIFGILFFCIGLLRSKPQPTVLASVFTALIGVTWVLTVMGLISTLLLTILSFFLFILIVVFELGLKIGPQSGQAKGLLIIPMFFLAFTLILAFPGLNQFVHFSVFWTTRLAQNPFTTTVTLNYIIVLFSYIATLLFCWIYIFDFAGWEVFKSKTYLWMNLLALTAIALSLIAWIQGRGIVTW